VCNQDPQETINRKRLILRIEDSTIVPGIMECPKCGIINGASARKCDCGYDFVLGAGAANGRPKSNTFGEEICRLRTAAGLSPRDVAQRTDLFIDYVLQIEAGKLSPTKDAFEKIQGLFQEAGVGADELEKLLARWTPPATPSEQYQAGSQVRRRNLRAAFGAPILGVLLVFLFAVYINPWDPTSELRRNNLFGRATGSSLISALNGAPVGHPLCGHDVILRGISGTQIGVGAWSIKDQDGLVSCPRSL
jgi:transcriptional regulator with XRE-family HTH domain